MLFRLRAAEPPSFPSFPSLTILFSSCHSLTPPHPSAELLLELHLLYCRPRGMALIKTARQPTTMRFN